MKLKRTGNTLTSNSKKYLISSRKKITPSKPELFLLEITSSGRKYISSLYGHYPEYEIEYKGKRYNLTLSDTSAELTEKVVSHV